MGGGTTVYPASGVTCHGWLHYLDSYIIAAIPRLPAHGLSWRVPSGGGRNPVAAGPIHSGRVTGAETVPTSSTTARTSSPGWMGAAPGVPVLNRSPGSRVMTCE